MENIEKQIKLIERMILMAQKINDNAVVYLLRERKVELEAELKSKEMEM